MSKLATFLNHAKTQSMIDRAEQLGFYIMDRKPAEMNYLSIPLCDRGESKNNQNGNRAVTLEIAFDISDVDGKSVLAWPVFDFYDSGVQLSDLPHEDSCWFCSSDDNVEREQLQSMIMQTINRTVYHGDDRQPYRLTAINHFVDVAVEFMNWANQFNQLKTETAQAA